jgi:hypothetical protein
MIVLMPLGLRPGLIGQHQLPVLDAAQTAELFHHGELYGELRVLHQLRQTQTLPVVLLLVPQLL